MKHRILVVEDNEQNIYLATFLLENSGFEVIQARTGAQALELAAKERPSLIILDIQLPETDGYAVARQLRSNGDLGHVPIVAVTSYAMAGDREKCLAAGCTGYIEKPIDPETFVAEVSRFLPKEGAGEPCQES